MDNNCILNELSLHGQYASAEEFLSAGAKSLASILCELKKHGIHVMYKKSDIYDSLVTKIIERTPWHLMRMNDGLDFKEFSKNRYTKDFFTTDEWSKKVMKFRVNDEIRCFGNVENDKFFVLRIDLDHKLSDLG